jgi:DNA-binding FadR family transcriptional regulator
MATVYEEVLDRLGPRIVSGELPEGSVLTLEWMRAEFGVSRTIAREVVQVLASMGLVETRRRTGTRVRRRERWDSYDPAVIR